MLATKDEFLLHIKHTVHTEEILAELVITYYHIALIMHQQCIGKWNEKGPNI